jgi:hypothetical protein
VRGTAELTVTAHGEADRHYAMRAGGGQISLQETADPRADARVSGSVDAWVDAFSPAGSRSALAISGDIGLVDGLLDACGATPTGHALRDTATG